MKELDCDPAPEVTRAERETMSYIDELFTRYGSPSEEADIKIWKSRGWLKRPDTCASFDDVRSYDDKAAQLIAECKHLTAQLIEYRQDLAARYNALATMPSKDSVKLERYNGYNGITYYIRHFTEYEGGTKVETATEAFPGKERRAAIKRFEELKKERPGIDYIKDIEKKSWER